MSPTPKLARKKSGTNREQLVKFLIESKVTKYKDGDFEVEISPLAFVKESTGSVFGDKPEVDIDEELFQRVMGNKKE